MTLMVYSFIQLLVVATGVEYLVKWNLAITVTFRTGQNGDLNCKVVVIQR